MILLREGLSPAQGGACPSGRCLPIPPQPSPALPALSTPRQGLASRGPSERPGPVSHPCFWDPPPALRVTLQMSHICPSPTLCTFPVGPWDPSGAVPPIHCSPRKGVHTHPHLGRAGLQRRPRIRRQWGGWCWAAPGGLGGRPLMEDVAAPLGLVGAPWPSEGRHLGQEAASRWSKTSS